MAAGDLPGQVAAVISNWADHADAAAHFGVPFHELPVDADNRAAQEGAVLDVLARYPVDLVVLARYMQVLTARIIGPYRNRIINIHHSFLPAFAGGRPYAQAHARGVKLIGATAHYATEDLDEGPIIDQDVDPGQPSRLGGRSGPQGPGPRDGRPGPGRAGPPHRPGPGLRQQDGRLRLMGAARSW